APPGRGSSAPAVRTGARTRPPPRARRETPSRRRRARARSRSAPPRSARPRDAARLPPARDRRPPLPPARRARAAPRRRRAALRRFARPCRAGLGPRGCRRSGGADGPLRGPFCLGGVLLREATDPDRRERRRLLDRQLAGAPQLEQREKRRGLLEPRELCDLGLEVEARTPPEQPAEALEELRHGREAQRHVRERDVGRILREQANRTGERLGILRRELRGDLRRERRRAEAEEAVALAGKALAEPAGRLLRAPVLGEPPGELLRGLLGIELGELGFLLGEERTRLQLEQRRDEDEELAAHLEIELVLLAEPLEEGDDDAGEVDVPQVELLLEDEREQQVERPLERVEVELELPDNHPRDPSSVTGRGPSGRPCAAPSARAAASARPSPTARG